MTVWTAIEGTPYYTTTATIANSATTSEELNAQNFVPIKIRLDSAFDGTTLSFTTSNATGGTFQVLEDGTGSTYTLTTSAASKDMGIPPDKAIWIGPYFKCVAGTSQTGATVLTLFAVQLAYQSRGY